MMELLKKRSTAAVILILVIALSVVGGSHRSIAAERNKVEVLLETGTGKDGSILADRKSQLGICANAASVAERYLSTDEVAALRSAVETATNSGTEEDYRAARQLADKVLAKLDAESGLSKSDQDYVSAFQSQLESYDLIIARNGYNDAARSFNEKVLGTFPANLLGGLTGIHPLEVYE